MKITKGLAALVIGLGIQTSVVAKEHLFTAQVAADGTVLRQWPEWIVKVEHQPQPNYFSLYKLHLNKRIVHQDPGFCSVSPIDASDYDRQLYGQAKVIGKPVVAKVDVMTQLVDKNGSSGDNSLEFLVMCTR
ncbi:hypothetical protein K8374_00435 [Pseudomonas sp. p1(2021b)]|uniref:hypothetical protein n=1 Tax=Pseudomonas sp. p1(2021b) TaxID=2874628 RepID=UPI001CCF83CD|nr:hypothetical protein [Pseudomonas sp. p1(2021b)]UBM25520.1 hypothetical protein K8374_00435 [Pseudomonas sp. p1(2021b)]